MIAASYDGPVTFLARLAIATTVVGLVGGWLLILARHAWHRLRGWRRARRRGGLVNDFWPRGSERWFR